jgi:hypothetical protein
MIAETLLRGGVVSINPASEDHSLRLGKALHEGLVVYDQTRPQLERALAQEPLFTKKKETPAEERDRLTAFLADRGETASDTLHEQAMRLAKVMGPSDLPLMAQFADVELLRQAGIAYMATPRGAFPC